MTVWALGINHETAPLDLRSRFALAPDQVQPALHRLRASLDHPSEATILSTCNRTEIYCTAPSQSLDALMHWLAEAGGVPLNDLRQHAYAKQDDEAARHAFRVASGLDSMVLGEPQILGQLKDAVRAAEQAGALGTTLHQLFQRSFAVAKEVRSNTEIGSHSISMAAAAVRLAAQLFEDLNRIHILFVGAGEMIELATAHFAAKSPKSMVIANRTMARGEALADKINASVMRLSDLPDRLHEFDAVISCTASTLPIIGLGAVERALKKRRNRPMFMVDLAVPRDIEPEVKDLSDVYLYTVDDLAAVVQTGKEQRQAAVAQAETIVDGGVREFMQWMSRRELAPMIQALQKQTHAWRDAELEKARKRLAKGETADMVMEQLANGVAQKILHPVWAELHRHDGEAHAEALRVIERMFLRSGNSDK